MNEQSDEEVIHCHRHQYGTQLRDDHLVRCDKNNSDDNSDEEFYGFMPEEIAPEISDYSDADIELTNDD